MPGRPANDAGPGNCGRVSCSYDAAIWWCNDVRYSNCDDIIESFQAHLFRLETARPLNHLGVLLMAHERFSNLCVIDDTVSGHVFHETDWNVIVRKDDC